MFFLIFAGVIGLGGLGLVIRWALSAPHGPLDGTARVVAGTVAGGLLAAWIVSASLGPHLNEVARRESAGMAPPSISQSRAIMEEVLLGAPVGITLAAGIGAGLGFFITLASVGSYRQA